MSSIENATCDAEISGPPTNPKSSKIFILSVFWLLCFVGNILYVCSGLDLNEFDTLTYPRYLSELKFTSICLRHPSQILKIGISIGPISTLGIPMMVICFLGASLNIILLTLHGIGSLVLLQLHRTEGPLSTSLAICFNFFLAAGFVGIVLASRSTPGVRTKLRT
jgi:hypothetical protein